MYYPYIDTYEFYENLPIYIFFTIIILLITIFVTIKLAFPFWNLQPVYHTYDFWRILYREPFYIHKRFVVQNITKFSDFQQIQTYDYNDAPQNVKDTFADILQCFYLPQEHSIFVLNVENLDAYFSAHIYASYISFYNPPFSKSPIGCISSRSGTIYFKHFGKQFPIYHIDYLCVKRGEPRNIHIARTLMQSHIYQLQSKESKKIGQGSPILSFLFKREKDLLSGIVPLSRFPTYFYKIPSSSDGLVEPLPTNFALHEIGKSNIQMFLDFLGSIKFSIFAVTDTANLIGLIETGVLRVYCLCHTEIYSVYIYRDTRTNYDDFGSVLELVSSIRNTSSQKLFLQGFINSLYDIVKHTPIYKVLVMDGISDNLLLSDEFNIIDHYQSAYYLYNMVSPQYPPQTILTIF